MRPVLTSVAVVFAMVCAASAQAPATVKLSSGLIIGKVVDGTTHAPIANAIVTLFGPGVPYRRVLVDAQGRFVFAQLPAGGFTILAQKTGYLAGAYGKVRHEGAGRTLELADGERVTDAVINLWRFATISGTVTDDVDDPVSGATVQIWKRAVTAGRWRLTNTGRTATADERGVYRVTGLPPGDYAAVITSLTSSLPAGLLVAAAAAKTMEGDALADFRRATATNGTSGFVNDLQQGFPAARVGDMLMQAGSGAAPTVGDGQSVNVYPTVWYPSASGPAEAGLIKLGAGDNRTGIDIHMTLVATRRISGTVSGPDGPVPYLALRLVPGGLDDVAAEVTTSLSASFYVAITATDATGAFTFLAVPPGQYVIRALTTPPPSPEPPPAATVIRTANGMEQRVPSGPAPPPMLSREQNLWTATAVSIGDKDISGVSITMQPGVRVTGRVEFDGAAAKPAGNDLRAIRVSLQPADGRTTWAPNGSPAQIAPDGTFYSSGVMAGTYLLRVDSAPTGWSVKSAMVNGRDMLDSGLVLNERDVTGLVLAFTDQPSRVSGVVRDNRGQPDDDAAVLIFPSDGGWTNLGISPRRQASIRTSRTGAFTFQGLPPGAYDVVAISDEVAVNWQDPAFLRRLTRIATHVTLVDGRSLTVDLTTAVVR